MGVKRGVEEEEEGAEAEEEEEEEDTAETIVGGNKGVVAELFLPERGEAAEINSVGAGTPPPPAALKKGRGGALSLNPPLPPPNTSSSPPTLSLRLLAPLGARGGGKATPPAPGMVGHHPPAGEGKGEGGKDWNCWELAEPPEGDAKRDMAARPMSVSEKLIGRGKPEGVRPPPERALLCPEGTRGGRGGTLTPWGGKRDPVPGGNTNGVPGTEEGGPWGVGGAKG